MINSTDNSNRLMQNDIKQNLPNLTKLNLTNVTAASFNNSDEGSMASSSQQRPAVVLDEEFREVFGSSISRFCDYFLQSPEILSKISRVPHDNATVGERSHNNEETEADSNIEYRTRSEIVNLTDDDILSAVYKVGLEHKLTEDQMFIVFNTLVSDDYSFFSEVINNATVQLEVDFYIEEGRNFVVRGTFTTDEKSFIVTQYPELNIVFKKGRRHDHGVAAACRAIDTFLLKRKTDMAAPCLDVGGNPMAYVNKGITNVHCCCPKLDVKDEERLRKRDEFVRVELRNIAKQKSMLALCDDPRMKKNRLEVAGIDRRALDTREYVCKRFSEKPWEFYCNDMAQDCDHQALYGLSVHAAYDIPIEEWPLIMIRHGLQIVHGCLLFHTDMLTLDSGDFPEMNMYYEKTKSGMIDFGFKDTMTPLYSHNTSEYLKYGHTQTITYGNYTFLYNVVKYRKYSLDFEITLLTDESALVEPLLEGVLVPSVYKGLVRITSIEYDGYGEYGSSNSYRPCETYMDAPGWKRLMDFCMSRGDGLTFEMVMHFCGSLSQNIIVNKVRISDGDRVTSDNITIIATAAYAIAIKMKYEGEDMMAKFRNDVDMKRKTRPSFWNVLNGTSIVDFHKKLCNDWVAQPLSAWKSSLIEKYWKDGLPEYLDMFSYEVVQWEDIDVEDVQYTMQECAKMLTRADETCAVYADSVLHLPNAKNGVFEALSAPEKAFIEAREALIEMGDLEALRELEAMSYAYFRAEAAGAVSILDSSESGTDSSRSDDRRRDKANDSSAGSSVGDSVFYQSEDSTTAPFVPSIRGDESEEVTLSVEEEHFEAEVLDDRAVDEEQLEAVEKYREALEADPFNPDLADVSHPDASVVSAMLTGGSYVLPLRELPLHGDVEYLGNTEDLMEAAERDRGDFGQLLPVRDHPHILYGPPKKTNVHEVKAYWKAAMREFQGLSSVQEEKKRDLASDHVLKYVEWAPHVCKNSGTVEIRPSIPSDIIKLHGAQYEPNILKFIGGVCESPKIQYDKYQIFNTSEDWMYGIDITTLEDIQKGKPKFVKIYRSRDGQKWFLKDKDICHRKIVRLYVEESLSVVLGMRFASVTQLYTGVTYDVYVPPVVVMMEMIFGAGKTRFIQYAAQKRHLVLTARKDAVGELTVAFSERGISPDMITVLTADSYMLNGKIEYDIVHMDEATMLHFGGIAAVCQKARPRVLCLYGDKEQISYTIRDSFSVAQFKLIPDTVHRFYSSVTWRTPADACALNAPIYGRHIWTVQSKLRSLDVQQIDSKQFNKIPLIKGGHYICFTNPDVSMLKSYFKSVKFRDYSMEDIPTVTRVGGKLQLTTKSKKKENVTTAHVAEGGTWDHVVIVRPTTVAYTTYDMLPHILVATTRHRKTCVYYSAKPGDKLWNRIVRVKNMSDEELKGYVTSKPPPEKEVLVDGVKTVPSVLEHPVYKIIQGSAVETVL